MVCLHVYTGKEIGEGLYFGGDKLSWDSSEEWEEFWRPLEAALVKGLECPSR